MIGKIYCARIADPDTIFDGAIHCIEDLDVMSLSFSHARGASAIINIECLNPETSLLSGPRYVLFSADVDGAPRELFRGMISGFPISLEGDAISVEVIAKRENQSDLIDALYALRDSEIPDDLVDSDTKRRGEGWFIDDVYNDPKTLDVSFAPIAGDAPPAATFYGAGSAAGESDILDMSVEITSAPLKSYSVKIQCDFEQSEYCSINAAENLTSIDPSLRFTYTPNALTNAMMSAQTSGNFDIKSAIVSTTKTVRELLVFTKAKEVDPITCVVNGPSVVSFPRYTIDSAEMPTIVSATQPRREFLTVKVTNDVPAQFAGAEEKDETVYLADAAKRCKKLDGYSYDPDGTGLHMILVNRTKVAGSVFVDEGVFRASTQDIIDAVAMKAAKNLIEAAHCVQISFSVPADIALDITLKDRVTINDARLPGGSATGKVSGIDIKISNSQTAEITILCPITTSTADNVSFDASTPQFDGEIVIRYPQKIEAVMYANVGYLVESIELINDATIQEMRMVSDETTPITDPKETMPKTGIYMKFADLTPAGVDEQTTTNLKLVDIPVQMTKGINI